MKMILGTLKHSLKLNHEQNGLFLKIHHEIERDNGRREKIEFAHFDVCDTNDIIAAVDINGNLYVFNLTEKCYWQLPEVSIVDIRVIKFLSVGIPERQQHNLLMANKSGFIYEIEINSGRTVRCIRAFSTEINQLLCSLSSAKTVVASTANQIKIYDGDKFTKKFEFSLRSELRIKFIKRIPHDDKLLAILHNDTICILSASLKLIRHYEPVQERERFLRKSNHTTEVMNYVKDDCDGSSNDGNSLPTNDDCIDDDKIIKSVTRDYQNGIVTDVAFDANGNNFVVAFSDNNSIMLCSAMMWDVRRVIAYPDFCVQQLAFVPHSNRNGNNRSSSNSNLLLTLTSNGNLMLTCMTDLNSRMLIDMNNVFRFVLSSNGRLLINLQHGNLLVYNLENHLNSLCKRVVRTRETRTASSAFSDEQHQQQQQSCYRKGLLQIQMKMKETMPRARLLPILTEFGEYPEKYRAMMWKTLLQLPENGEAFAALLRSELCSSVSNYDKRFSLADHKALNNLKQIMSCLAHWSPLLGNVSYLPKFVFPFVKLARGDLLFCFELVATLLLNQCRRWFEHAPMVQTPYHYLHLCESVLMRMDRRLYDFYQTKGITSEHYALPLMESAFSEVLDEHTWLQLWDHIVSNEPAFLVFAIVALNSTLRPIIVKLDSAESVRRAFYEPNYINLKKLTKKAHAFMRKCPSSIHPRRSMASFMPLSSGEYQKFEQQGNLINANVTDEMETLREEQRALDRKLAEVASFERSMEARMEGILIDEENQRRMKEIESKFARALDEEEQRIIYQRKLLLLNTKKAREKEIEMIIQMKNAFLRSEVETGSRDLETMLHGIEKQRVREEIEMQMAEENLKLREIALQMKALKVDVGGGGRCAGLQERYRDAADKLVEQHRKFMTELKQLETSTVPSPSAPLVSHESESATSITTTASYEGYQPEVDALERAFNELQDEYNHWAGKAEKSDHDKRHIQRLKDEMDKLEGEINSLLMNLGGAHRTLDTISK